MDAEEQKKWSASNKGKSNAYSSGQRAADYSAETTKVVDNSKRVTNTPGKRDKNDNCHSHQSGKANSINNTDGDNSGTYVDDVNNSKRVQKTLGKNKETQQSTDSNDGENSGTNFDNVNDENSGTNFDNNEDGENSGTNFDNNKDCNTDDTSIANNSPINPSDLMWPEIKPTISRPCTRDWSQVKWRCHLSRSRSPPWRISRMSSN